MWTRRVVGPQSILAVSPGPMPLIRVVAAVVVAAAVVAVAADTVVATVVAVATTTTTTTLPTIAARSKGLPKPARRLMIRTTLSTSAGS